MPEALPLTFGWMLAVLAGLLLGAFFFGGLWWTVRKGLTSKHPALLFSASLLLRIGIAIAGFYWVGREVGPVAGQATWQPLLLCLLGFALARPLVLWLTRRTTHPATETRHAS